MSSKAKQKGVRQKGWLNKRGGRIHTWHKRWFVLTGDLLFYYKSPQESRPTGTIPLAGNKVFRHRDEGKQPPYRFEIIAGSAGHVITSNHETYLISADSAELADSWVAAIRRVMHEPYGGGMFGRSLEETMKVEARLGGFYVPVLLHRCVKFIQEHGLHEVGIFRLPGQASRIQALKELYDSGSQEEFSSTEDVHTVASLLKLYLRELPQSVVPFAFYDSYKLALEDHFAHESGRSVSPEGDRLEPLKRLLIQLPVDNFNVLKYISRFLHEVDANSETNKMNSMNLGTIFGPHLLRPETDDPQALMDCNSVSTNFVRALIQNLQEFFPLKIDERAPKRLSIVFQPGVTPPWIQQADDSATPMMAQRSFYQPKGRYISFRPRQNSAPPSHKGKFGGKVASMVEQFNNLKGAKHGAGENQQTNRNVEITGPILNYQPGMTVPPQPLKLRSQSPEQQKTSDSSMWKSNPIFTSNEPSSDDDDEEVPEIIKRLSQNGLPSGKQLSDTLSSDMIVNSISNELESLEQQLIICREEVTQHKKSARLWKSRYELEHRARLAAEQRITDLQNLVDETFQQFALDDSEDEFEDGEGSPAFNSPGTVHRGSYPLLNMEYTVPALKNLSSSLGLKTYSSSPTLTKSTGGMGNY